MNILYKVNTAAKISLAQRLQFIYKGGLTTRYHTQLTIKKQDVAAHSFGVAWLVVMLYPDASRELILAALAHDLAEHRVGDVPSPAKQSYPDLKKAVNAAEHDILRIECFGHVDLLTPYERSVLRVADMLDGMMFCLRERQLGNKEIVDVWDNYLSYVHSIPELWQEATDLIEVIETLWEKANGS